jgi:hypothetical protein
VEYDEPGPFSFVDGPESVSAQEAIDWARRHAQRVSVRVGEVTYSAGIEPLPGLPEWADGPSTPVQEPDDAEPALWQAEGRTAWSRPDLADVASRLADAVRAELGGGTVREVTSKYGFRVTFILTAPSAVAAREAASGTLRRAWTATGIDAIPGDDFDLTSVTAARLADLANGP